MVQIVALHCESGLYWISSHFSIPTNRPRSCYLCSGHFRCEVFSDDGNGCPALFFQSLCSQLESSDYSDIIDGVDLENGVLEIHLSGRKGTIVLNKHYIHRQIWYSSPNR